MLKITTYFLLLSTVRTGIAWLLLVLLAHPVAHAQETPSATVEVMGVAGKGLPIAVVGPAGTLLDTVQHDLLLSGMFEIIPSTRTTVRPYQQWQKNTVYTVAELIPLSTQNGNVRCEVELHDIAKTQVLHRFTIEARQQLQLGHKVADEIQRHLTGIEGVASSRIVYASRIRENNRFSYKLVSAYADGSAPQIIFQSDQPLLSPAIAPDGKKIAYVSFENQKAQVFVHDLVSEKRTPVVMPNDLASSSPAWSPDSKRLAFAVMENGATNLYVMEWSNRQTKAITSDNNISTEPVFANDNRLFFISDRSGGPQIYVYDFSNRDARRLTFDGRYNFSPQVHGKYLAYIGQGAQGFRIRIRDMENNNEFPLYSQGSDEAVAFAPNGKNLLVVIRENKQQGARQLIRLALYGRPGIAIKTNGEPTDIAWFPR